MGLDFFVGFFFFFFFPLVLYFGVFLFVCFLCITFLVASGACWFPEEQANITSHSGTEGLLSGSSCQAGAIPSGSE